MVIDGSEALVDAAADKKDADTNETDGFPGGIVGFKLDYFQEAC